MIAAQIAKDFAKIRYSLAKAIPLFLLAVVIIVPIALILNQAVKSSPAAKPQSTQSILISDGLQSTSLAGHFSGRKDIDVRYEPSTSAIESAIQEREARLGILPGDSPGSAVMLIRPGEDVADLMSEFKMSLLLSGADTQITLEHVARGADQSTGAGAAWAILVTFIILSNMISSFLVWEERSKGYLEELIASPATHTSIMISKLFAVLLACAAVVLPVIILGVIVTLGMALTGSGESLSDSFRIFADLNAAVYLDLAFFAFAIMFAIATVCAIMVVLQITLRDRMVISTLQMILSVPLFFVPVVLPSSLFENATWAWAIPVVNIYADLSYAMVNNLSGYSFMPMMATNIIATGLVIAVGRFAVSRIREWPAR
ncbi:hypothetical protein [Marinobacter alkaliphilus]|uniref:ABC transporter permease n=1 Tax=Marinobacter alkaliphilus TaxID=254719 RepID=A0ABZ3E967_9GAMM